MAGLPNGGMVWDASAPTDNGGPMSAMSSTAVVGTGSRPIGQGKFVPGSQPTQNQVPGGTPTPAGAAANQQQRPPQGQGSPSVPNNQPTRSAAPQSQPQQQPPQTRPASNQVPTQTRPSSNQVANIPPQMPTKEKESPYGPIAGDGFDCTQLASPGEIKARVYTIGTMITPCHIKNRSLEFALDDKRAKILQYKCHGGRDRVGDLSRVICMGIELIGCKNELPITVDFGVTGTTGRDYNWTEGTRSLLSMPPHYEEMNGSAPRKLFMHAPTVSISALRRFSHLKTAHLSAGIQQMFDEHGRPEDWSMVHTSSPVVDLIRHSHETLKPTLANVRLTENRMPIKNALIKSIQNFLQEKINECPGNDWRKAAVSFSRASGNAFCDPDGYAGYEAIDKNFELQQSFAVYTKFILYFLILSNSIACQKLSAKASDAPILPTSAVAGAIGGPVNGI